MGEAQSTYVCVNINTNSLLFFQITGNTRVCSKHFAREEFKETLAGDSSLRRTAVPSIFEWTRGNKQRRKIIRNATMYVWIWKLLNCSDVVHNKPTTYTQAARATQQFKGGGRLILV